MAFVGHRSQGLAGRPAGDPRLSLFALEQRRACAVEQGGLCWRILLTAWWLNTRKNSLMQSEDSAAVVSREQTRTVSAFKGVPRSYENTASPIGPP